MDTSKRNRNAGVHPSYKGMSTAAIKKKKAYDTAYHKTTERKKYRAELNKANRKTGKVGDGKDQSHTKKGGLVLEPQKSNRGRNGQGGGSTKK